MKYVEKQCSKVDMSYVGYPGKALNLKALARNGYLMKSTVKRMLGWGKSYVSVLVLCVL